MFAASVVENICLQPQWLNQCVCCICVFYVSCKCQVKSITSLFHLKETWVPHMDNEQQLNIYMYFYSAKVSTSSAVKELYTLINSLLGKITSIPLPSAAPVDFLLLLSTRFAKSVIPLTARLFIPLRTVLGGVISLVHPCVDLRESPMELC